MIPLKLLLPILLLVYTFLIKLFIDRKPTIPIFVNSILELPVDIVYLAISFVAAYTIFTPLDIEKEKGIIFLVTYIIVSIIVIFIFRRSSSFYEMDRHYSATILAFVDYIICITAMVMAINLITGIIS